MAYLDQLLQRLNAASAAAAEPAVELPEPVSAGNRGADGALPGTASASGGGENGGFAASGRSGPSVSAQGAAALLARLEQAEAMASLAPPVGSAAGMASGRAVGETARAALGGVSFQPLPPEGGFVPDWPETGGWDAARQTYGAASPTMGEISRFFQRDARRYG